MPPGTQSESEIEISIVTTLYYSAPYLEEFYRRIRTEVDKITSNYEIILVNDGSPDNVLEVALSLYENDSQIRILDLSRNFGHHRAMMTGLRHSTGKYVFVIDVDLEEPPELLGRCWNRITEDQEIDVVYGQIEKKPQTFLRNLLSSSFYFIFNLLSPFAIPRCALMARLMKRRYVDALLTYTERELFIPAIWIDVGFHQVHIPARKTYKGNSTYTLKKRLIMAVDAIASFSNTPLLLVFYVGSAISAMAITFILYLILLKIFFSQIILGWTSIIASIYLMGGFIMFSIGVLGIYLSKIYTEIKHRPYSIVKHLYESGGHDKTVNNTHRNNSLVINRSGTSGIHT